MFTHQPIDIQLISVECPIYSVNYFNETTVVMGLGEETYAAMLKLALGTILAAAVINCLLWRSISFPSVITVSEFHFGRFV